MLVVAVVVNGNNAAANIGLIANNCIAEVTQMTCLGTSSDARLFRFDEVTDAILTLQTSPCAQIGKRVHLSAAAQIGGVLEPVNDAPVIIEDDVLVGGNCGIFEGTLVRARAVLGAGTILTRSTPLYDLVKGEVYRGSEDAPLQVPENAVVVPGSRAVKKGKGAEWNLSLYTPVIVKYRDEKTDRGIELENWLR